MKKVTVHYTYLVEYESTDIIEDDEDPESCVQDDLDDVIEVDSQEYMEPTIKVEEDYDI